MGSLFQLPVGLLNATMLFHKIIDEICCVFILELFMCNTHSIQQLLPLWGNVTALKYKVMFVNYKV